MLVIQHVYESFKKTNFKKSRIEFGFFTSNDANRLRKT